MPPRPTRGTLPLPPVKSVALTAPFDWLAKGWHDMWRIGWPSLLHGLVLAVFGAMLAWAAHDRFWLLAGAFSGFLIVAPVLATSLYALSRALERDEPANLGTIGKTWTRWQYSRFAVHGGYWSLVRFGLLLSLAGTGWVMTSAALITALAPAPVNTLQDFLHHVVLARHGFLFELWMVLGALMAAPLFASSVVSMPLLLDRRCDVLQAVLTSWQTVMTNPGALALWAVLILGLTVLGMLTALLGLVVIVPWLGHASWHAYRALVDTSRLPERLPPEGQA
ncbi:DUF2189 domain-containing protein [Ottowia sp.]|uniref:DUF2189 domain-containing protein n=1 Tax=Ottowia sp. TaxID=1898956 RepID=UPI003A8ACA5A